MTGSSIMPPIGNGLAGLWSGASSAFWAFSVLTALVLLTLIHIKANKHLEVSASIAADYSKGTGQFSYPAPKKNVVKTT